MASASTEDLPAALVAWPTHGVLSLPTSPYDKATTVLMMSHPHDSQLNLWEKKKGKERGQMTEESTFLVTGQDASKVSR